MEETKRMPRPLGFTLQMMRYNNEPAEEDLKTINTSIVRHWLTNSFTWCKVKMDVAEISQLFDIESSFIIKEISNYSNNIGGFLDKDQIKDTYYNLVSMAMSFAMTDRAEIVQQMELLKASQDGHYRAFISSEVRQQQTNLLQSGKNFLDIATKIVPPSTGTNVQIFNTNTAQTENNKYIDITQANKIISESMISVNNNEDVLAKTLQAVEGMDLPEVAAKKQTSIDVNIPTDKLLGQPDPYIGKRLDTSLLSSDNEWAISDEIIDNMEEEEEKRKHLTRREDEYEIDPDEFIGEA